MSRFFVPLLLVLLVSTEHLYAQHRLPATFEGTTSQQETLALEGASSPYQTAFPDEVGPNTTILLGLEGERRWYRYVLIGAAAGAGTVLAATLLPFSPWYAEAGFDDGFVGWALMVYAPAAAVLGGLVGAGVYLFPVGR